MATDLFVVSHAPDVVWLEYMLRSIDKYAVGFRQTIVAYPAVDQSVIDPVCSAHPRVRQSRFQHSDNGHLDQNIQKTCADLHSDADFFLHIDSDCAFTENASPLDYSTDGKPDLWYDEYENLKFAHPGGVPWQGVTENALGMPTLVDTMRRFPILYPRWLYGNTRARIEERHGVGFEAYVRSAPKIGRAYHGYCEFNALGSVGYYLFPEQFTLLHMTKYHLKPTKLKQFWTHWIRQNPEKFRNEVLPELEKITEGYNVAARAA